jgi:glycosyltransferase involved in cell wall biosynthesis
MKIAVIVHRLGPYHVARLNALATRCELSVIELSDTDSTYAWDKVSQGCDFRRQTLVKDLDTDPAARRLLPAALARALAAAAPEAVAAPGWGFPGALLALQWCLGKGVPAILMSDSQAADHARSPYKEWIKAFVVSRYSAAFVAGTSSAAYVKALGMAQERTIPGYDVVDNSHFKAGAGQARGNPALRQALGLPPRYWLACSRFVPQKNLPMLLKAYARYRAGAKDEPFDLVMLGDGPQKAELLALRDSLGLAEWVRFPGFAQYPDLPSYYGLASAFLLVSGIEPWGLVVNEAMAAGLPVLVSSACGCAPDLVREGQNGYSFDPLDEDALLNAMLALHGQGSAGLEAMGRAAEATIGAWSPASFADNMVKAAQAALTAPKPGSRRLSGFLLKALARLR